VLVVRATGTKLFGVRRPQRCPPAAAACAPEPRQRWPLQVSAVPLALLLSTIQFLSREGVRNACQRIDVVRAGKPFDAGATRTDLVRIVNLSWCVLPLAAAVAPLCAAAALWRGYDGVEAAEYRELVLIFGLAAVLELLAEPAYNLVVVCDKLHIRALVDGAAITAKAVVIWSLVSRSVGVLAFAWGQAAYAVAQLAGLYGYAASRALGGGGRDFPLDSLWLLRPHVRSNLL